MLLKATRKYFTNVTHDVILYFYLGAAALYVSKDNSETPQQIKTRMLSDSTLNKVTDVKGSPNKLLYIGNVSTQCQKKQSVQLKMLFAVCRL